MADTNHMRLENNSQKLVTNGYGTNTAALVRRSLAMDMRVGSVIRFVVSNLHGVPMVWPRSQRQTSAHPTDPRTLNNGGWCNPPRTHLNMAKPAFMQIARWKASMSPSCTAGYLKSGMKFSLQGNGYWLLVTS
ncbi:expansin-A7-like [Cynara cardunculus var. scolymus]|uniref:expansin-A7-like n=1 Tax=Cynara cardunculus var. scolymus TaxID=59895 RepID=UPI000D62B33D|nr:expansin-A7-like [Cynara cardunculus var. scolymus]